MKIIKSSILSDKQKHSALKIWNAEYPVRLVMPDITEFEDFLARRVNAKHYLLITEVDDELVGWAVTYPLEGACCFFIMISGSFHGKGYGTLLLNELKKDEKQLFGWAIDHNNDIKSNGEPYLSPINFYIKNNFTINTDIRIDNEQLSAVNIIWEKEIDKK